MLINKSPSAAIDFKTLDEKWYGKATRYGHLRTFGCRAYAHIKQDKLEARAMKCVFIGYPKGIKGYKLWCTEAGSQRVIISRDVVFKEEMSFLKQGKVDSVSANRLDSTGIEV